MLNSIIFLGGSQTFVGVLATVIVMCVLAGETNFIYKILSLIKNQMSDNLKNVSSDVNFSKLNNDSDFKLLKVLISDKKRLNEHQQKEGGKLLNRASLWKSTFQIESAKPELQGEDREIALAPLYSFLFILVIFVCDELLSNPMVSCNDYIVSSLSLFTLISSLYWLGTWLAYVIDLFRNNGNRTYSLLSEGYFSKMMQVLHYSFLKKDWIRIIIEVLWFVIIAFLLAVLKIAGLWLLLTLTFGGVILPLIFEGFYHFNPIGCQQSVSDKGYKTTLNHFGRFLLMSLVMASVYIFLNENIPAFKGMLQPYDGLQWVKISTIGFVILNGLVAPSVLPFHCYRHLSNSVLHRPDFLQKRVDKDIVCFLKEVKKFTSHCEIIDDEVQQTSSDK